MESWGLKLNVYSLLTKNDCNDYNLDSAHWLYSLFVSNQIHALNVPNNIKSDTLRKWIHTFS